MRLPIVLLAGLVITSCASNTGPERACTLIGCDNGVEVQVVHSLGQPFSVTVRNTLGDPMYSFICQPGQPCRAFIAGQTPQDVRVTVNAPQGEVSKTFKPEYKISKPNGPDCPPDCKQATIVMNVS